MILRYIEPLSSICSIFTSNKAIVPQTLATEVTYTLAYVTSFNKDPARNAFVMFASQFHV